MTPRRALTARLHEALRLHRQGDIGGAAGIYREIIAADPSHADAYQLLAVIARQMNDAPLAMRLLETALDHQPRHAPALTNHALLLRESGDLAAAKKQALAAVAADPGHAEAHVALGAMLQGERDYEGALRHYYIAQHKMPADPELANNIATAHLRLGQLPNAHEAVRRALLQNPGCGRFHNNLGNILRAAGHNDLAAAAFAQAAALEPENTDIAVNRAMNLLLTGDFEEGWRHFARRPAAQQNLAAWRGENDPAIRLLVLAEQGLGDSLQFSRFLSVARQRVGTLAFAAQQPLIALLAASMPDIQIIAQESAAQYGATHYCRLLDLCDIFGMSFAAIPDAAPWLRAPEPAPTLRDIVAARAAPVIGLVWAGNPGHLNDANRSLPFSDLAPFIEPVQDHCLSLQKGPQIKELSLPIPDAGALLHDFAATASLLQHLDLVLTADTSVAHLAGALGCPVWIMLPYDPDWRWGLERRDVPFYPTAKLYREPASGERQTMLRQIGADLAAFIAGDRDLLHPPPHHGPAPKRHAAPTALPGLDRK